MANQFVNTPNHDVNLQAVTNFCAPYQGTVCKAHLTHQFIFYNYTGGDKGTLNEKITNNLWRELIAPLSEPCRSAAETLLCNYAFPACDRTTFPHQAKPLCREDCVAVRDSFCVNPWALVETNKNKGILIKAREHFRLPECELLPSHDNNDNPPCTHAHLTDIKPQEVTIDCLKGNGRFYQGYQNRTRSGIPCQRWDKQEPHKHDRPPPVFPEIQGAENFCRNAGGEEPMPWCYTTHPDVRWEYCEISKCSK